MGTEPSLQPDSQRPLESARRSGRSRAAGRTSARRPSQTYHGIGVETAFGPPPTSIRWSRSLGRRPATGLAAGALVVDVEVERLLRALSAERFPATAGQPVCRVCGPPGTGQGTGVRVP